jgi:hypothetical protein
MSIRKQGSGEITSPDDQQPYRPRHAAPDGPAEGSLRAEGMLQADPGRSTPAPGPWSPADEAGLAGESDEA